MNNFNKGNDMTHKDRIEMVVGGVLEINELTHKEVSTTDRLLDTTEKVALFDTFAKIALPLVFRDWEKQAKGERDVISGLDSELAADAYQLAYWMLVRRQEFIDLE